MSSLKYADLLVLIAALAVFLVAGLPMLGFAVAAAAWLAQRGIGEVASRRSQAELAAGNRQKAMGVVAATTLARVWLMATVVLVGGLTLGDEVGLTSGVLLVVLFTVSFAAQGLTHLFADEPQARGAA